MSHYSDDYEYEANKRRANQQIAKHDAKKALIIALELANKCKPYDEGNYRTKIIEAMFWLDGPGIED